MSQQLDATLVRTLVDGVHPSLASHLQVLNIPTLDDAPHKLINDSSIILQQLKYIRPSTLKYIRQFKNHRFP